MLELGHKAIHIGTELRGPARTAGPDPFYFGCEADDRMISVAFNRRLDPLGKTLKPVFCFDIGTGTCSIAGTVVADAAAALLAGHGSKAVRPMAS